MTTKSTIEQRTGTVTDAGYIRTGMGPENNAAARQQISSDSGFTWYLESIRGFDYAAAMGRRCPNWIEAMLQRRPDDRPALSGLLTENGLLMQAEEIAAHYRRTGRFPRIALLDDLLVHGRSINRFLQNLLELLAACLDEDADSLRDKLCKSLIVFAPAVNDAPVLLRIGNSYIGDFPQLISTEAGKEDPFEVLSVQPFGKRIHVDVVLRSSASLPIIDKCRKARVKRKNNPTPPPRYTDPVYGEEEDGNDYLLR